MRYSHEHKEATHERILDAAMSLLQKEGVRGSTVERVMKAAGLTVGGFYAHFKSKKALVAETFRRAMGRRRKQWLGSLEDLEGDELLEQFVRVYLSRAHRDDLANCCPLPGTLSEFTRVDQDVGRLVASELEETLQAIIPRLQMPDARERAIAALAQAIGALTLARATRGTPLSDEFIAAGRALFRRNR
jgi:TetR/AcrR family transcriptional repressor of nem operon